jgi:hypothetical protein
MGLWDGDGAADVTTLLVGFDPTSADHTMAPPATLAACGRFLPGPVR